MMTACADAGGSAGAAARSVEEFGRLETSMQVDAREPPFCVEGEGREGGREEMAVSEVERCFAAVKRVS